MTQDFSHVVPAPAIPVAQQPALPLIAASPAPVVPNQIPPQQSDTGVTPENAHQILAMLHDVVSRLVAVAHISDDEKRAHANALNNALTVETAEERAARAQKEAQIASLQAQIADLQK